MALTRFRLFRACIDSGVRPPGKVARLKGTQVKHFQMIRIAHVLASLFLMMAPFRPVLAGNVFVTGHDPDFHGVLGGNASGAQNIISRGLDFARNGNTAPILYIQTSTVNNGLGDHTDSEAVLPLVGYSPGGTPGNHYVKVDATQFATTTLAG
jgi:hypothetical protein